MSAVLMPININICTVLTSGTRSNLKVQGHKTQSAGREILLRVPPHFYGVPLGETALQQMGWHSREFLFRSNYRMCNVTVLQILTMEVHGRQPGAGLTIKAENDWRDGRLIVVLQC